MDRRHGATSADGERPRRSGLGHFWRRVMVSPSGTSPPSGVLQKDSRQEQTLRMSPASAQYGAGHTLTLTGRNRSIGVRGSRAKNRPLKTRRISGAQIWCEGGYLSFFGVTSLSSPVVKSQTNPRITTFEGIHGCDLSFQVPAFVSPGSRRNRNGIYREIQPTRRIVCGGGSRTLLPKTFPFRSQCVQ